LTRRPPTDLASAIPAALRRLRESRSLSQRALATRSRSFTQGELAQWEAAPDTQKNARQISLGNLSRVLSALDASLHDLADALDGPRIAATSPSDVLRLVADQHARILELEAQVARLRSRQGAKEA
jgi:transcriptional regulator with XRE-family HTH domain